MFADVIDQLLDFAVAKVLKKVETLRSEHLGAADASAVAPPVVAWNPCKRSFGVGLRGNGVRDWPVCEALVVCMEDFTGQLWGRSDYGCDEAKAKGHERAIDFGQLRERLVRSRS